MILFLLATLFLLQLWFSYLHNWEVDIGAKLLWSKFTAEYRMCLLVVQVMIIFDLTNLCICYFSQYSMIYTEVGNLSSHIGSFRNTKIVYTSRVQVLFCMFNFLQILNSWFFVWIFNYNYTGYFLPVLECCVNRKCVIT
jgi:hypothetical protein